MSSLRSPSQNAPYTIKHTEQHKTRRTSRRNRIQKTYYFCVHILLTSSSSIQHILYNFSDDCSSTRERGVGIIRGTCIAIAFPLRYDVPKRQSLLYHDSSRRMAVAGMVFYV